MLSRICQVLGGIVLGWLYFYYWGLNAPHFIIQFEKAHELSSWTRVLSVPFVMIIASLRFSLIRWGLLSFSLVVLILSGLVTYAWSQQFMF
jgi:hypothetical protein